MLESCEQLNNQAVSLAARGAYTEAIACLRRAITMQKTNYRLWFNLALTYNESGKINDAINAMEKAFLINSTDEEVIDTLAVFNQIAGKLEKAMQYCSLGLAINDKNPHFWNTKGVVHFNLTDYGKACEAFEHAVTLDPYYYDALFNLCDTYSELGNKAGEKACRDQMAMLKRR